MNSTPQMRDIVITEFMANQRKLDMLIQLKLAEYEKRLDAIELQLKE